MYFIQGQATMYIEARQKGTCEALTELATRFIGWSSPLLCSALGFKELGMPMGVGPCQLTNPEQETEIFSTQVSLPWMKEDTWRIHTDGILFKSFVLQLVADGLPVPS